MCAKIEGVHNRVRYPVGPTGGYGVKVGARNHIN